MRKSLWNQDGLAGLMFVAFGVFGLWFGRNYGFGTAARMGPGSVPILLSGGMILFGGLISLRGVTIGGARVAALRLRPILAILGGLAVFCLLLERAGLPLAAFCCVALGTLGGSPVRPRETILLAAVLALGVTATFVFGLGLPFRLWP